MLKVLGFVLIIALGLAAPAGDKMSRIPVHYLTCRAILKPITPASMQDILMLDSPLDLSTISLWSPKMGQKIEIQSLYG